MRSLILIVLLWLFSQPISAQAPSKFCRDPIPEGIVLEVDVTGRGMIWPNLITQVFFRLRNDGQVEYDARSRSAMVRKKFKLQSAAMARLLRIIDQQDLSEARDEYPMLESMKDAVLKTCVSYRGAKGERKVLLVNYSPTHPKAEGYYPNSLVSVLSAVAEFRPSTKFERQYGGAQAGLP